MTMLTDSIDFELIDQNDNSFRTKAYTVFTSNYGTKLVLQFRNFDLLHLKDGDAVVVKVFNRLFSGKVNRLRIYQSGDYKSLEFNVES